MNGWWAVPVLIAGIVLGGAISQMAVMHTLGSTINECERANNVYQCKLVPMPVDPFHPENPK